MQNRLELIRAATRPVRSRIFDSAGWDEFQLRGDDIVISTYPKCGTTWMQRIVGMLVFGSAEPFPVQDASPWPDFRLIPPEAILQLGAGQGHRRFLKSHLPFDALPFYQGVKYIHVARDGRDFTITKQITHPMWLTGFFKLVATIQNSTILLQLSRPTRPTISMTG